MGMLINTEHPRIIDKIMVDAIKSGTSDVHLEPKEENYKLRFRIDGLLYNKKNLNQNDAKQLATALKIKAKLNIAETRLPQDGGFSWQNENLNYDIRLATCPTIYGEKIVVRILNSSSCQLDLNKLGLEEKQKITLLEKLTRNEGMVLVTGPTGSGKTQTLYSMLNYLQNEHKNIMSVEDPVEIKLNGVNQVAIKPKIGLTFAKSLRAFLRQDPDIIMLGEIRDEESAKIAISASQTGHLVLATLHTNSALDTFSRLLNMGISHFDLANSVTLVIAQRLVRKICPKCKAKNSCENSNCHQGYSGRTGIFEILPITDTLAHRLVRDKHASNLLTLAQQDGFKTLSEIGEIKIKNGVTDRKELLRVVG